MHASLRLLRLRRLRRLHRLLRRLSLHTLKNALLRLRRLLGRSAPGGVRRRRVHPVLELVLVSVRLALLLMRQLPSP